MSLTTIITEQITSYNYRTGYSYSAAGHNVETVGDVPISPEATITNNQTVGGVNFSWTGPNADKPQWQVVHPGESWSITESLLTPGLDAVTNVTRTIQTTTTTESQSVFSPVALALGGPAQANTTVANPQSTNTGQATVNAYQMMTGPHPVYRMSQGIQCPEPHPYRFALRHRGQKL